MCCKGSVRHTGHGFSAGGCVAWHGLSPRPTEYRRFYIRCTRCSAELTFKTDPKNSDYICEGGAQRNFEPWREERIISDELAAERAKEEEYNPMKALENRTVDSKREMDILDALDEIQTRNARSERVNADAVLERMVRDGKMRQALTEQQQDEEDERLAKMIFTGASNGVTENHALSNENEIVRRIGVREEEYTASLRNQAKNAAKSISSVNLRDDGEDGNEEEVDGDLEDLDALVRLSSGSHRMTPTVAPSAAGIASSSTLKRPAATSLDLGIVKKPKPATIDDVGKGGRKAVQKPTNTTINKPLAKPPLVAALNLLGDYDDEDAEDGEP